MNYEKIYYSIVAKRKQTAPDGYAEKHHITPRSIGGSDDPDNLVLLTPREHFICHGLLVKMYTRTPQYYKMVKAFFMMLLESKNQARYCPSREYAKLKEAFSLAQSVSQTGKNNSRFGTQWVTDLSSGKSFTLDKTLPIPDNYVLGRNKKQTACPCCGGMFVLRRAEKYCSAQCSKVMIGQSSKAHQKVIVNKLPVSVDGTAYASIAEAAKELKVGTETARRRFRSKAFPGWIIRN